MGTIKIEAGKMYYQHVGKWHTIGEVNLSQRTLTVHRNRDKHLMKVFNGYGFNREIIESDRFFDYVALEEINGDEATTYFIPTADILEKGRLYQAEGLDKQIFLSLSQLEDYKI